MPTGYLLPSLAIIFRIPAPPSLSSQFFPAYNAVQLFIRSSLSAALSAFLPPTALPSVRMIMPFHGDDPLLTRAYIASTLRHPLSTHVHRQNAFAHTLKGTYIYTFCHWALLRHGVNECPRDSIHRLGVHSTGKILACSWRGLTSHTRRMCWTMDRVNKMEQMLLLLSLEASARNTSKNIRTLVWTRRAFAFMSIKNAARRCEW